MPMNPQPLPAYADYAPRPIKVQGDFRPPAVRYPVGMTTTKAAHLLMKLARFKSAPAGARKGAARGKVSRGAKGAKGKGKAK